MMNNVPIHKRKRRLPKPAVEIPQELPKHEQRRHELHKLYPHIPLKDIFVDPVNGVELFRNQDSGNWVYNPEHVKGV